MHYYINVWQDIKTGVLECDFPVPTKFAAIDNAAHEIYCRKTATTHYVHTLFNTENEVEVLMLHKEISDEMDRLRKTEFEDLPQATILPFKRK